MTGPEAVSQILARVPEIKRWYDAEFGDDPPSEVGPYVVFDMAIMPFVRRAFETGDDWDALLRLFREAEALHQSGDPELTNLVAVGMCESLLANPGLDACRDLLGRTARITCERMARGWTWPADP